MSLPIRVPAIRCQHYIFTVMQKKNKNRVTASCRPPASSADTEDAEGTTGGGWDDSSGSGGAHTEHSHLAVQRLCASSWTPELLASDQSERAKRTRSRGRRVAASHGAADGCVGHGTRARYSSSFRFMPCSLPSPPRTYGRDQEPCGRARWRGLLSSRLRAPLAAALLECPECVPAEGPDEIDSMRKSS